MRRVSMAPQCDVFAGRLVGLLIGEAMVVERVRLLVLDEADKLAEEGFEPQLRYLLTALPARKQTLSSPPPACRPPPPLTPARTTQADPRLLRHLSATAARRAPRSNAPASRALPRPRGETSGRLPGCLRLPGHTPRVRAPDLSSLVLFHALSTSLLPRTRHAHSLGARCAARCRG